MMPKKQNQQQHEKNQAVCDAKTCALNTTIARTTTKMTKAEPVCYGIMNAPAASHIGGLVSRHHETSDLDKDSYNFVGVSFHIHSIS